MVRELSPFELDRELARVVPRARAAYRALRSGREVTLTVPEVLRDRETIERVASDASDPIAAPLLRWLYWLELMQRALPGEGERVRRYRGDRHALDLPLAGHFSWRELLGHALRDAGRRQALVDVQLERGDDLRGALARASELRAQWPTFAGRERAALEQPHPDVPALAQRFLTQTADALASLGLGTLSDVMGAGLAHGADDGWPRQLSLRSLHDLLGESSWLSGLRLEVGVLPAALAPASFVRGFLRLGAAFSDALAPTGQPFAIAFDPFGLARSTHGALLAGLAISPVFLKRRLGLSGSRATGHARALAQSALLFTRQLALRVLLNAPALQGTGALREAFLEHGSRALGFELPERAAWLFFRPRVGDAQRLCGAMLAATRAEQLAEDHDEDWFRNPRAIEQRRAEAHLPAPTSAETAALDAGAARLGRELARHL